MYEVALRAVDGDRSLQSNAWKVADALGWIDTLDAEYVALTGLYADAFITLDRELAQAATAKIPWTYVVCVNAVTGKTITIGRP